MEFRRYNRKGSVLAREMPGTFQISGIDGKIQQGKPGDFLVKCDPPRIVDGVEDQWPVDREQFLATHEPAEAAGYTLAELEAMTKSELIDLAEKNHGIEFTGRPSKNALIEALLNTNASA